jgi:hypothetical protein
MSNGIKNVVSENVCRTATLLYQIFYLLSQTKGIRTKINFPLSSRLLAWRTSLYTMLVLLICLIPLYFFYSLIRMQRFSKDHKLILKIKVIQNSFNQFYHSHHSVELAWLFVFPLEIGRIFSCSQCALRNFFYTTGDNLHTYIFKKSNYLVFE